MPGAVVGGFLDPVGVVPSSFHDARVGAVPALRVEVLRLGDVGRDLGPQGGGVGLAVCGAATR